MPAARAWDWHVELHATGDISRLMKEREQFALGLRAIEERGIQHVPERGMFREGSTPELFLETFPEVSSGWGWPHPKSSPRIHLMWPSVGGAVGPGAVNTFVSNFLATLTESGALEKLTRIDAARRHVFIWLESTHMVVWSSFCDKGLPTERPDLPEGLTDVARRAMRRQRSGLVSPTRRTLGAGRCLGLELGPPPAHRAHGEGSVSEQFACRTILLEGLEIHILAAHTAHVSCCVSLAPAAGALDVVLVSEIHDLDHPGPVGKPRVYAYRANRGWLVTPAP